MWLYWIIGILLLLIIVEELIYYLENRIAFGKRKSRIGNWIASLRKKEDLPVNDGPRTRRRR